MKKSGIVLTFVLGLSIVAAHALMVRGGVTWIGEGGWGSDSAYSKMYNSKTVETITGEVVNVQRFVPFKGMSQGVYIDVKTDQEAVTVHLGPAWFLKRQADLIQEEDMVEVKGSTITFREKQIIVAAEVKKGNATLTLRDTAGFPVWSAWR